MNRKVTYAIALSLAAGLALAQEPPQQQMPPQQQQQPPGQATSQGWPQVQQGQPVNPPQYQNPGDGAAPQYPPPNIPATLTLKGGTFVTVRLNQYLNSDHNQAGDAFSATLTAPIVVDGIVVAARGQNVAGRVTEAKKAGRVEGTSRLGIQLTNLTLVDGQQEPVQSELITRNGPTSVGRDAGAIAGTTAVGAAAGAIAGSGAAAGIGAGAGAVVGIVGVMLTRGHPTILGPETMLTFRIDAPISVSTQNSAAAFRYVVPGDYQQQGPLGYQARRMPPPPGSYYGAPGYYPYGYPYPYYYPYWGPGFSFYYGPRFFGGSRGFFRR